MIAFWIIIVAIILNINTSIIGSFLVVRKMSMMSDAISHAVLPGIVIAYMLSGSLHSIYILIGAILFGMLTTFIIQLFSKLRHVEQGAAIGTIYTFLFACGVVLISYFTRQVDLDLDCVLYGEIAYIPLDVFIVNNINWGPKAFYILSISLIIISLIVKMFFKELVATSFDHDYSKSLGIPTEVVHYILMFLVSIITVISFELVGAILVIAFLVGPPATAYLWTHSIKKMIVLSILLGSLSIIIGYFIAFFLNASIAGAIAFVIGVIFIASILLNHLFAKRKAVNSYPLKVKRIKNQ